MGTVAGIGVGMGIIRVPRTVGDGYKYLSPSSSLVTTTTFSVHLTSQLFQSYSRLARVPKGEPLGISAAVFNGLDDQQQRHITDVIS